MKKRILEKLKTRFEGVSESVLGRIAEKLAKTAGTEAEADAAAEGVTLQQVIESYGDSRATEASQTARQNAVKEYETKYGLKDGVTVEPAGDHKRVVFMSGIKDFGATGAPGDPGHPGEQGKVTMEEKKEEMPGWAKALMGEIASLKQSRTAEKRRAELTAVTGNLPESARKAYSRLNLESMSEADFSTLLEEVKGENATAADTAAASGAVTGKPGAAGSAQQTGALTKEQLANITQRDGKGGDGQPF